MRLGVIRLDGESLAVAGDGLIQLFQVLERIAKVVIRLGIIWLDGEGLIIAGDGPRAGSVSMSRGDFRAWAG